VTRSEVYTTHFVKELVYCWLEGCLFWAVMRKFAIRTMKRLTWFF